MFSSKSRYKSVETYRFKRLDGSEVVIRKKRKIPKPKMKLIHTVQEGERTDLLAYRYYRDPLMFWKLADGNEEMNPEQLVEEPGEQIVVPANDPEKKR